MRHSLTILVALFVLGCAQLRAEHIVGGEMSYECLGNDDYRITLKVYRDCNGSGAQFDQPAAIGVFDQSNNLVTTLELNYAFSTVPVVIDNPCLVAPPNVCVEEAIYSGIKNLPGIVGGYRLVYQRCCRNKTIANLNLPGTQGATYIETIPGIGLVKCNSSPVFNNFPPVAICSNEKLAFDHSATDPDGDVLVYSLCAPYQGADQSTPKPNPPILPFTNPVNWASGFSAVNPMPANPALAINPSTGLLTGKPTLIGQYVVGVCVKEYRNNVLIGEHRRDFQFNVANCDPLVKAVIPKPNADTVTHCTSFEFNFENQSFGTNSYFWDFGVAGVADDTSGDEFPFYKYPDTGVYTIMLVANPGLTCSDTDYIVVRLYPSMMPGFDFVNACGNEEIQFIDHSSDSLGDITLRFWQFGDGSIDTGQFPTHTYHGNGPYQVRQEVRNNFGCILDTIRTIDPHDVPVASFSHETPCIHSPIQFSDQSTIATGSIAQHFWSADTSTASEANPTFQFDSAGFYTVQLVAESDQGCRDTTERTFEIREPVSAGVSTDTSICTGSPATLSAGGGLYFEWFPKSSIFRPNEPDILVTPLTTTVYTLITSDDCTDDTAEVTVTVHPIPQFEAYGDTAVKFSEEAYLSGETELFNYYWTSGLLADTVWTKDLTIQASESGVYYFNVVDMFGCTYRQGVHVEVLPVCDRFHVPTAFSPNGDGRNDRFGAVDYGNAVVEELKVFNRWGQLIWKSAGETWDGMVNGGPAPMDVYVYLYRLQCDERTTLKSGSVTLLR